VLAYGQHQSNDHLKKGLHHEVLQREGVQARKDRRFHAYQLASCDRGNVTRAYLRLRAQEFRQTDLNAQSFTTREAPVLFPILSCDLAVQGINGVLTHAEEMRAIDIVRHRRQPVIVKGIVVGSKKLP
jgi:hypothetical protein